MSKLEPQASKAPRLMFAWNPTRNGIDLNINKAKQQFERQRKESLVISSVLQPIRNESLFPLR